MWFQFLRLLNAFFEENAADKCLNLSVYLSCEKQISFFDLTRRESSHSSQMHGVTGAMQLQILDVRTSTAYSYYD